MCVCACDCNTKHQIADFLTKPLGTSTFWTLTQAAMGHQVQTSRENYARRDWKAE
jgi:hypothetical protein